MLQTEERGLSVGLSVTLVSPAKTAAPIDMPFGLWARMGRRNRVLDGGPAMLRDVAMTTNFGTKIAINWLCVNDMARQLIMEAGLSNADALHLRDVAMAIIFCFLYTGAH